MTKQEILDRIKKLYDMSYGYSPFNEVSMNMCLANLRRELKKLLDKSDE
jgi:hypothetical protein